ncbi:outer membrane beta-barrel protein [Rugamonas sp. FT107W]|uniref:Outer membrane beta-barrel protein n=1 Tax=Duganella vulcania TaxID=2692166 RepID=A0A845HJG1_9BURK|nr:XrtB/PEP-CTERM-associated polysaccharide biosynthesis outer membrane protein EpsL [Duganella vulcania]MYN17685.1 outer membrane beta-barrel protein [Duganella vulcania]
MPPSAHRATLLLLIGVAASAPARADFSDTLHPFVGVGYSYEDNLLRLSDAAKAAGAVGSDSSRQAFAGVAFERPLGRQLFTGSARVSRVSFDRFTELDYSGKDANGEWKWQLGNDLSGTLGGTYSESLSSFSDFHAAERNVRTQRGAYFEAKYQFVPHWQLRGRTSRDKYDYEALQQQYLNRDVNAVEAGLDYLAGTGSSIGVQARRTRAAYPNPLSFGGVVFDQAYRQTDVKLKVRWQISAITQLEFLGGRARRTHLYFAGADSSGANGRASFSWVPEPSLTFNAAVWKDYSPYEGIGGVSYSQDKGASVGAGWQFKPQLQLGAQLRTTRREFVGASNAALPANANDRIGTASLSATYNWTRQLSITASAFREQRSSGSFLSSAYSAKGASVNASLQF